MATEVEKLVRDIQTLTDAIKGDFRDLHQLRLGEVEREGIHRHIDWCIEELRGLQDQMRELDN
jgi:hypothetical protein